MLVDQLIKPNDRAISDSGSDFVAHENFTIHIKSISYFLVNEGNKFYEAEKDTNRVMPSLT